MRTATPHGAGAKVDPEGPRLERVPADEQPPPATDVADPLADGRDRQGRVRTREAASALARLPRRRDLLPAVLGASSPEFEPHYKRRLEWREHRRSELVALGRGALSFGVLARLNHAAWLFAGAEFAAAQAAKTGRLDLLSTSATLAAQADRLDWSAYHMACREARLREPAEGEPRGPEDAGKLLPGGGGRR
jgi:hypothetical protein